MIKWPLYLKIDEFLYLIYRLENLGAYSIQDALSIIFSPRDLRAFGLLNKLAKSKTLSDEKEVIQALGVSRSQVSADNLLKKLDRFCFLVARALEKRIGFFVILLKGDEIDMSMPVGRYTPRMLNVPGITHSLFPLSPTRVIGLKGGSPDFRNGKDSG